METKEDAPLDPVQLEWCLREIIRLYERANKKDAHCAWQMYLIAKRAFEG